MNMTSRQKKIAASIYPLWNGWATKSEVKRARKLARGKYWNDKDYDMFVAFSPKGYRKFFDYDDKCKEEERIKARKYSKGLR